MELFPSQLHHEKMDEMMSEVKGRKEGEEESPREGKRVHPTCTPSESTPVYVRCWADGRAHGVKRHQRPVLLRPITPNETDEDRQ